MSVCKEGYLGGSGTGGANECGEEFVLSETRRPRPRRCPYVPYHIIHVHHDGEVWPCGGRKGAGSGGRVGWVKNNKSKNDNYATLRNVCVGVTNYTATMDLMRLFIETKTTSNK